jgi:hypothetical protein
MQLTGLFRSHSLFIGRRTGPSLLGRPVEVGVLVLGRKTLGLGGNHMKIHLFLMLSLSLLLALGVVGFAEAGNKRPLMQEEEVQEPVVALQAAIECQN